VTTSPSRLLRPWIGEGEGIWLVPLLRAEGGEKEPQVGLVAPEEDGRPTEAETMTLPLKPDEALERRLRRDPRPRHTARWCPYS
jgi:hypothetical protein